MKFYRAVCSIFLFAHLITNSVTAEPYKIGAILPLSGELAGFGSSVREGLELALKELPSGESAPIKIIYEDDQLTPTKSIAAFNKLALEDKVGAVIVFGSGIGNTISPLAEKRKVVMVAVGASDSRVSAGKTFSFTHWVSPEIEGQAIAAEVKRRGYKRIALLTHENDGLLALASAFKNELRASGLGTSLVVEKSFVPDTKDFKSILPLLKEKEIDAVTPLLFPTALGIFARQSREQGVHAEIFGADIFEDADAVKTSQGALNGSWYSIGSNGTLDFEKRFKAEYGKPPGTGAANAFDTLLLLAKALGSGNSDNSAIAERLRTVKDFSGACGTYSATGDNRFALPAVLKTVTANGFELIKGS